nr:MAG TPA: hypothetical protein [Caudoviricetes sp.]
MCTFPRQLKYTIFSLHFARSVFFVPKFTI